MFLAHSSPTDFEEILQMERDMNKRPKDFLEKGSQLPFNDKDDSQFISSRILIAPTDVESFETVTPRRMGEETYAEIVDKLELHNLHWERFQLL